MWATIPPVDLYVPSNLAAVSRVVDYSALAADPEGQAWQLILGAVPAGIQAVQGVGNVGAKSITYTYPLQAANPATDLTFSIPLSLSQGSVAVPSSANQQVVRVHRYSPRAISSAYTFLSSPGVTGIVASGFSLTTVSYTHLTLPTKA